MPNAVDYNNRSVLLCFVTQNITVVACCIAVLDQLYWLYLFFPLHIFFSTLAFESVVPTLLPQAVPLGVRYRHVSPMATSLPPDVRAGTIFFLSACGLRVCPDMHKFSNSEGSFSLFSFVSWGIFLFLSDSHSLRTAQLSVGVCGLVHRAEEVPSCVPGS